MSAAPVVVAITTPALPAPGITHGWPTAVEDELHWYFLRSGAEPFSV
jgi:hypothetical protein